MHSALPAKTTAGGRSLLLILMIAVVLFASCSSRQQPQAEHEEEALARTEFTDRIENFFEYEPLKAGKPSQFLIHLTDLSDGTPIEKADVTLVTRSKSGGEVLQTKARIGKVTGIYVADVAIPTSGNYDIEFHIKNSKVDERLALTDFKVE
jgi:5-hydroxyisourate hydrolase-like protein (transthyretin family)